MLRRLLHHPNPFVRRGATHALGLSKWFRRVACSGEDYLRSPPVIANSVPKSGTHLLDQMVGGLPDVRDYGAFLSSMTSSFRFRERSDSSVEAFLGRVTPGELVRAHLFASDRVAAALSRINAVHYFIYRDPRAVVVSEAHYLRSMNRWHRLHPWFRDASSVEEAIAIAIRGLNSEGSGVNYPDVSVRFSRYEGWIGDPGVMAIRFEDLLSPQRDHIATQMAAFYSERAQGDVDIRATAEAIVAGIAPEKSHTFRAGKPRGWDAEFTPELRRLFADVTGDLLHRLGYETDRSWVDRAPASAAITT